MTSEAQEYLIKLLKDHASNPSTDGLEYGIWAEGGWKKLFRRAPINIKHEDIDRVIAILDTEDFWRKVWWRKIASEDITKKQKEDWIRQACECEIVGPCSTTDWETGEPTPNNYPAKWRICDKCHAELPTIEIRQEHQTKCNGSYEK